MQDTLITIFCEIDDFCKENKKKIDIFLNENLNKVRNRKHKLTLSEILTIMIFFNSSKRHNFKDYYEKDILNHYSGEFKNLVCYNRFLEFKKKYGIILYFFLKLNKFNKPHDILYIDSFAIKSCNIKREYSHKVMKKIARKGKNSMGWFYGMKLNLLAACNGDIADFQITAGNIADNNADFLINFFKNINNVKIFGDRGYIINQELKDKLKNNNINIITRKRNNMKNADLSALDQHILNKRNVIESIGNILKNHLNLEHTFHRSICGFFINIFSALCAYVFLPKKPSVSIDFMQHP